MSEALTMPTQANFDHLKGQNTHFALWSTVFMLSGDVFTLTSAKSWQGLVEILFDIQIVFSWMGDALTMPTIAIFNHFKGLNTYFAPI